MGHFKESCAHYVKIMGENAIRINAINIEYKPQGPNSNSVAFTLLVKAGLKFDQQKINQTIGPNGSLPGWGTLL